MSHKRNYLQKPSDALAPCNIKCICHCRTIVNKLATIHNDTKLFDLKMWYFQSHDANLNFVINELNMKNSAFNGS